MMKRIRKALLYSLLFLCIVAVAPSCSTATDAATLQAVQHATCPFCQIIAHKAPADVVYETADVLVILKRHPVQGIDCLIIPKKHIENLKFLDMHDPYDMAIANKMIDVANELSKMMTGGDGDYSLQINNGKNAYQTVFHMHWHFKAPRSCWKSSVCIQKWPKK